MHGNAWSSGKDTWHSPRKLGFDTRDQDFGQCTGFYAVIGPTIDEITHCRRLITYTLSDLEKLLHKNTSKQNHKDNSKTIT